jgi:hypothetical protein
LKWSTALRHLAELQGLVKESHIQWEGRPSRPNDSRFWGQAMDRLVEQPPKKLPLKSHGYLRAMVYDIADESDRQVEKKRNSTEACGGAAFRKIDHDKFERVDADAMRRIREAKGL